MAKRVPAPNASSKETPPSAEDYKQQAAEHLERADTLQLAHAIKSDAVVFIPTNLAPNLRSDDRFELSKTERSLRHIARSLSDLAALMGNGAHDEGEAILLRVVEAMEPRSGSGAWCALMYRAGVEAARGVMAHGFDARVASDAVALVAAARLRARDGFAREYAEAIYLEASGAEPSKNALKQAIADAFTKSETAIGDGFKELDRLEAHYSKRAEYRALVWGTMALFSLREQSRER